MARTYHAGPPAVRATEKELRIVGKAIKGAEWHLQGLVATLAMTGMRPGEWLGSNFSDKPQWIWKQVDLAKGRLHLPAVTHKTGQRPGKDRAIYLCKEAVKVLKAMPGTVT